MTKIQMYLLSLLNFSATISSYYFNALCNPQPRWGSDMIAQGWALTCPGFITLHCNRSQISMPSVGHCKSARDIANKRIGQANKRIGQDCKISVEEYFLGV